MKKIIIILAAAFLATSCLMDGGSNDPVPDNTDPDKYLSFTVKGRLDSGATKGVGADSDYNEGVIDFDGTEKDVHIFFFATDRTTCILYPEAERLSLGTSIDPGETVIRIKLKPDGSDSFAEFDPLKLIGQNTVMYIVANSSLDRSAFMNGGDVKTLDEIMATVLTASFNEINADAIVKQDKFVMDCLRNVYITGRENVADLTLKRAAAKIQLGISNAMASGYTPVSARIKMVNYANKSLLGNRDGEQLYSLADTDYGTSDYIPAELPATPGTPLYAEPFYSYESDWSNDDAREAYLLIEMMWYADGLTPADAQPYYYKLPLSYIPADSENGAAYRERIRRNYIYRYNLTVMSLGSHDPATPTTVESGLTIVGWDDQNIAVSIQKFDWLFVEEQTVSIYPAQGAQVQTYLIPYKSSSPLSFSTDGGIIATYEKYDVSAGAENNYTVTTDCTGNQIPTVDPNYVVDGNRFIKVESRVPVNYVPKNIYFKVRNEAELYATVSITHYPPLYVTGEPTDKGTPTFSARNNNLYTITTLGLTGNENFNWEWNGAGSELRMKQYLIGDPKTGSSGDTYVNNADNAWVVSPKFTVQSQYGYYRIIGFSAGLSYNDASNRCNNQYSESGYEAGTWRLPTMAELFLISKLQTDNNSALNDALVAGIFIDRAWSVGNYLLTGSQVGYQGATFIYDSKEGGNPTDNWFGITAMPVCVRDYYQ